ncbi:MAG: hypothetical protein ABIE70_02585 [bacterium]
MSAGEYIPTGRTSLVKDAEKPIQVQTEYASRPYPRITTCVSHRGQVVHKIEKRLKRELSSEGEQQRAEMAIARQHAEVLSIIQQQARTGSGRVPQAIDCPDLSCGGQEAQPLPNAQQTTEGNAQPLAIDEPATLGERIRETVGVEHVFEMDSHGNFRGVHAQKQFRSEFKALFKNLPDLLDVFALMPESDFRREQGVCEIERDRLYLISTGTECYLVTVRPIERGTDFEKSFKHLLQSYQ